MTSLRGSVVLVTGANGGLGQEFVRQALARGAQKVYATARRPGRWNDDRVVPLTLDVTDQASINAAASQAPDTTIVINNAGTTGAPSLLTAPFEDIRSLYETNVLGVLATTRAFAPILAANGGGALVNVASVLSWLPAPGAYPGTKSALWGISNSFRLELAAQNTQVVSAHLAYTDTPMIATLDVPKGNPKDVVTAVYDGTEAGLDEVLADDTTRYVKANLGGRPQHQ